MEAKTSKRFVSKGEYVKIQGKRMGTGLLALCLMLLTIACGVAALLCIIQVAVLSHNPGREWVTILSLWGILPFSLTALVFSRMSSETLERAVSTDAGVPLTRANTADLPAPDSLVRASQVPMQAQEAVLLRAAAQESQTPSEQLVRAAGASEEL